MGFTRIFSIFLFALLLLFVNLFFAKPVFADQPLDFVNPTISATVTCGTDTLTAANGGTITCSQSSANLSVVFSDNQGLSATSSAITTSPTITCNPTTLSTDQDNPTTTQTCTASLTNSTSSYTISANAADFALNSASISFTLNFTYSIKGSVWKDLDADGSKNGSDANYDDGTVDLTANDGTTTYEASTATGSYTFDELPTGTYTVTLVVPSGYQATTTNPIGSITIGPNATGKNFGITQLFSISGNVFIDYDHNATKNGDDIFSPDRTIELTGDGTGTDTSDTNGGYSFVNLVAGDYTVALTIPANHQATLPTTNCVPTTCISPGTTSYSITLGPDATGKDFGISPLYSIEGSIYEDTDGTGTKTGTDPLFTGGIVLSCSDGPSACTPATANGTYTTGTILLSGTYTITVDSTPTGYKTVTPASIPVAVPPSATNQDFLVIGYKITGNVFVDNNHDQVWQTATESAYTSLASPTIAVDSTTSHTVSYPGNGVFKAVNLTLRQYWVTIYVPSGYKLTTRNPSVVFPDNGTCYDPSTTPDWTLLGSPGYSLCDGGKAYQTTFTITATTGDIGIDFGITPLYTISGNIYEDKNGTSAYDSTPTPADTAFTNSIVLDLLDSSGALLNTATTTTGDYTFTRVLSGTYSVTTNSTPTGYETVIYIGQSPSYNGAPTQPFTISANLTGINFLVQGFTISGNVFKDYDHNGAKDISDDVFPGAKVTLGNLLYNGSFETWNNGYGSGTTDRAEPDGWSRTPVNDGYSRRETPAHNGSYNWMRTAYGDGGAFMWGQQDVIVKPDTTYQLTGWLLESNFFGGASAKICASTISDIDIQCTTINTNSTDWQQLKIASFDSGTNTIIRVRFGINSSQTALWDDFVLSEVVTTSATGAYSFTDLSTGTYTVSLIDDNPGYTSQYPGSLANPYTVTISTLGITHDFSTTPLYTISGYIYRDVDGNGGYTSGTDTAFSTGVTDAIHLKDTSGTEITASSPVNSNSSGYYAFANILSGSYNVTVDTPTGFKTILYSTTQAGTYSSTSPSLVINETNNPLPLRTQNLYALVQGFTISGNVFKDYDHNGARDASDINYSGATLSITDTCPGSKTTDASGNYSFVNLTTGAYSVKLCVPSNYQATTTNPVPITISALDATADFGITPLYQITGYVYKDTNKDEYRNAGESVYTGDIAITATDPTGANVGSVATSSGTFTITGLLASTDAVPSYTITYSGLPAGYEATYPKPTQYTVVVGQNVTGYTCGPITSGHVVNAVSCPGSNGNISDLGFGITDSIVWKQCIGGNCVVPVGIVIPVPQSPPPAPAACGTQLYASIEGYNNLSPGIFFSGNQQFSFCKGGTCQDRSSSTGWVVGGSADPEDYQYQNPNALRSSYDYMVTTARQSGITPKPLTNTQCGGSGLANCNLSTTNLDSGIYQADGNLTLSSSSNCPASASRGTQRCYQFPNNKQYIILVNGDLTINENILVPTSSTVTLAVKGDIKVDKTIGTTHSIYCNPASTAHDGCNLEGYYSADKSFIIQGNSSDTTSVCASGASDLRLNIAGSIVAGADLSRAGTINNQRDLCALNLQCPAFTVTARPDFILNAPDFIRHPNYIWKEEAP